jgi:RNA polymerase sigma factor (sigma-70 family)
VIQTGDAAAAEDIVQDIAVMLLEKKDILQRVHNPNAYLSACIRNASVNHIKKNNMAKSTDFNSIEEYLLKPTYDASIEDMEIKDWLSSHIKQPKEISEAFYSYTFEGYTINELAKKHDVTPNTLAQRFKRIRSTLHKKHFPDN